MLNDLPEKGSGAVSRPAAFAALVGAQDDGLSVPMSRKVVAERFGLTVAEVVGIEREGLEHQWPPLSEDKR